MSHRYSTVKLLCTFVQNVDTFIGARTIRYIMSIHDTKPGAAGRERNSPGRAAAPGQITIGTELCLRDDPRLRTGQQTRPSGSTAGRNIQQSGQLAGQTAAGEERLGRPVTARSLFCHWRHQTAAELPGGHRRQLASDALLHQSCVADHRRT